MQTDRVCKDSNKTLVRGALTSVVQLSFTEDGHTTSTGDTNSGVDDEEDEDDNDDDDDDDDDEVNEIMEGLILQIDFEEWGEVAAAVSSAVGWPLDRRNRYAKTSLSVPVFLKIANNSAAICACTNREN